jgi:predicted nuclease with TOPRIM domain
MSDQKYHQALTANRKLLDENARLKAEVDRLQNNCDYLDKTLDDEIDKTAMLCGQVERLRKAGDNLYKSMLEIGCNEMADNFQHDAWLGSMRAWKSAKEGKGQP